jgi:hypothetical protein
MCVLLVTHRFEPYLHIWWRVWLQQKLWILRNNPPLQPEVPAENVLPFQEIALNMWLIANRITLFITKLRHGGWIFRNNSTQAANKQPSSYTAVQVTDFNFDTFQTTTQIFHQIRVQWQMWIMRKITLIQAQTLPRRCPFFSWNVLHYWSIDAKRKSAVANDIAVREVQFQKNIFSTPIIISYVDSPKAKWTY